MPWNAVFPSLQLSNNVDSSPKEVQGSPVRFCGGNPTGKHITVKMLKMSSWQGMHDVFQEEVEIISRVRHTHLVTMIGYYMTRAERLLVNEFIPNNNLEFHLHGIGQPVMKWETRRRITIGTAKGLAYLHEYCTKTVADFGLAKFLSGTNGGDGDDDNDDVPNSLTGVTENSGRGLCLLKLWRSKNLTVLLIPDFKGIITTTRWLLWLHVLLHASGTLHNIDH